MKTVAIIPARGGSKGVPRKNLRRVGALSLVAHSIRHAKAEHLDEVYVTSDSREILEEAERYGAAPIERPADLATDTANGDLVAVHTLNAIGITETTVPDDHVTVFLQPTSPIRPHGIIRECLIRLGRPPEWDYDSIFTAYDGHFAWRVAKEDIHRPGPHRMTPTPPWAKRVMRQQIDAYSKVFIENGCVYATRTSELLKFRVQPFELDQHPLPTRLCGRVGVVEMSRDDSIDIDTEYDLWLACQRLVYLETREERAV